jgi:hypothetical protein
LAGLFAAGAAHLGLAVAVETGRPHWRDPDFGHRLPLAVAAPHDRPLVIALGSSRTQMGLRPDALHLPNATVVNFSTAGAGPYHHGLTLDRLRRAGVRPDYVLVELLPAALTQDSPADAAFLPYAATLSAADVRRLAPICSDPAALWKAWAANRANSWFTLRLVLMSHFQPNLLPWTARQDFRWRDMDGAGWLPYPFEPVPEADRRKGFARTRAEYEKALATFHIAPGPDRAVRDLVAEAKREGIRVAFYLMPESPEFRTWYSPATRAVLRDYLAALTNETGAPVFEASDWLGEAAFSDGHHLLKSGATTFSERFGRECVGPWIAAGH